MRDDFPSSVKELLAKRVGYRCSNPDCRHLTSGPQTHPDKFINVGVAAHITAASIEGHRFDESLSSEQRREASNGIWLCQKCAKLIDNDSIRYTVGKLINWKHRAEDAALQEIEKGESTDKKTSALPYFDVYFKARTDYNRLRIRNIGDATAIRINVDPVPLNYEKYPGKTIGFRTIPYLEPQAEASLVFTYDSFGTPEEQNNSGLHQDPRVSQYLNNGEYILHLSFADKEGKSYGQLIDMKDGISNPSPIYKANENLIINVRQSVYTKDYRGIIITVKLTNPSNQPNTITQVSIEIENEIYEPNLPPLGVLLGDCDWFESQHVRLNEWDSVSGAWFFGGGIMGCPIELQSRTFIVFRVVPVRGITYEANLLVIPLAELS